jgi:hypothetical protein
MIRKTLELAHSTLEKEKIDHALIGGFALSMLGINRATADINLIIMGSDKQKAIEILKSAGFSLNHSSFEVIHFSGIGRLDILLANRPMSQSMLSSAKPIQPNNIKCLAAEDIIGLKIQSYKNDDRRAFQDKADIVALIDKCKNLDWDRIKKFADVFDEWDFIQSLKRST